MTTTMAIKTVLRKGLQSSYRLRTNALAGGGSNFLGSASSSSWSSSLSFSSLWQSSSPQSPPRRYEWSGPCRTMSSAPMAAVHEDDDEDEIRHPHPQQHHNHKFNAFEILGVPETFDINEAELKENYRTRMNQSHPDRQKYNTPSSSSQSTTTTKMHQEASTITHAYDQLSNPLSRAIHLLEIHGKPLEESKQMNDMEFLMTVMEIREHIDQIIREHCCCCCCCKEDNGANCDARLKPFFQENKVRIQNTCQELKDAFAKHDWDQALALTARLQYWNRIEETIRERMGNLE